jgi:hypothetical protein
MKVKVEKDEIEEAQENKGSTIMTASGVPIKISPSGAITVEQKSGPQAAKSTPVKKSTTTPAKAASKLTPAAQKAAGPAKLNGAPAVKKTPATNGAIKKMVPAPTKSKVTNTAPKKLWYKLAGTSYVLWVRSTFMGKGIWLGHYTLGLQEDMEIFRTSGLYTLWVYDIKAVGVRRAH